jgi:1-deoxy-D-xylulose-5-phosphate synthase
MLYTGFLLDQPAAVRYPRGGGPGAAIEKTMTALPIGKAKLVRQGKGTAILAFGPMVAVALQVGEEIDATVINMRFIKPLDEELLLDLAKTHEWLVTVEENVIAGGAGSAVAENLSAHGIYKPIIHYGLPDRLIPHGSREEMLKDAGLTVQGFREFILRHTDIRRSWRAARRA